jgi:tRNA nucleotidyltransferase (CCA-adding enzyme)
MFARVSGARIRHEFDLIFREREPEKSFARADELGALKAIYAKLEFAEWHSAKFRAARELEAQPSAVTYLGLLAYRLTPADAAEFCQRLRLSNQEIKTIMQLLALQRDVEPRLTVDSLAPSALYRLLMRYENEALALYALATDSEPVCEGVTLFRTHLRDISSELTGDDLRRMGIRPGPQYREILQALRDARLDGKISSRAEEEHIVQELLSRSDD